MTKSAHERLISFLLREKTPAWSWNYWSSTTKEHRAIPYPDDLDDSFAALIALWQFDSRIIDGSALACITKLLTTLEIKEGGPYMTWLIDSPLQKDSKWGDVDVVVNSTIGYFLSFFGITLPAIDRLLGEAILQNNIFSPYYPSVWHSAYFISRYYQSKNNPLFAAAIRKTYESTYADMNLLETGLAISSFINLRFPTAFISDMVPILLQKIYNEGWRSSAFCLDPSRDGIPFYAGSPALTAGICVEAIVQYQNFSKIRLRDHFIINPSFQRQELSHATIVDLAVRDCSHLGGDLGRVSCCELSREGNDHTTLPVREFHNLLSKRGMIISPNTSSRLATSSLYGWTAYTIFDDFLDGEGDPERLPSASLFLRKTTEIFALLEKTIPGAWDIHQNLMNTMDRANTWEQTTCRFSTQENNGFVDSMPVFKNHNFLADRSVGYALGPLVQLLAVGYPKKSKEHHLVLAFFRNYLIARQLHDDARDWEEDLLHGRATSVLSLITKNIPEKYFEMCRLYSAKEALPIFRRTFWNDSVDEISALVMHYLRLSREIRQKTSVLQNTYFMEKSLMALENATKSVIEEKSNVMKFLRSYTTAP